MSWCVPRLYLTMFTNNSSIDRSTGKRNAGPMHRSEKKRSVAATMACSSWMERLNVISTGSPSSPSTPDGLGDRWRRATAVKAHGATIAPIRRLDRNAVHGDRCCRRGLGQAHYPVPAMLLASRHSRYETCRCLGARLSLVG